MAATDARPVPRKNVAFRLYFAVRKNDGTLITTWAGQDSEVSLDGAAFADCTNEATEIGTSGCGYLDLTSSEMNADCVILKVTVTNTDALPLVLTLFPEESGDYRSDVVMVSGDATAADNAESFFDGTGYAGTNNVIPTTTNVTTVNGLAAGVITATSIAADAITDAKVASDVTIASVTGAVGSVTGNVGGSVGSVTAAITLPTIPTAWITADGIAADAIGSSELAASAISEIQSGLSTLDAAGVRTAIGLASANLDTQLTAIDDLIDTEIAALTTEVAKIPKVGSTHRYTQVAADSGTKRADVAITVTP